MRLIRKLACTAAGLCFFITEPYAIADTTNSGASGQGQPVTGAPVQGNVVQKFNEFVTIGGLIEGDTIFARNYEGADTSDFELSTVELILDAKVTEWATGHIVVTYEGGEDEGLFLDEANITLGKIDEFPLFLSTGRVYAPFGNFSTNMLQDPLTLTISEINTLGVISGFDTHGVSGRLFGFEGMNETGEDNTIHGFGAALSYTYEQDGTAFNAGVSWVNNIADADGISDTLDEAGLDTISSRVNGLGTHLVAKYGPFSLIGEYIFALNSFEPEELAFDNNGAKPSALNGELAYTTELWAKETVIAAGYQQSRQALTLGLPEQRLIASASIEIFAGTTMAIEYYRDQDYSMADGGTNEDGHGFTTRLTYVF